MCLAHLERYEEAGAIRKRFGDIGSDEDESGLHVLTNLFDAAIVVGDRETAQVLARRLAPLAARPCAPMLGVSHARLLGSAAALLDEPEQARAYYRQALDVSERVRNRPEIAIAHLELADLLLNRYPDARAEALQHLDIAIAELRDMKMQPMLERALRIKLRLQGVNDVRPGTSIDALRLAAATDPPDLRPQAAPDGTVTLLFTDIEDSTGLTLELGDQRWLEVLRVHHTLVRAEVQRFGGFEVKNQGDGFMLAFGSARRALDCAVAIQRALALQQSEVPMRVRMGLHTGEVLKDGNDFHGRDVLLAARIANEARGGEILVSGLVRDLVGRNHEIQFGTSREVELKGLGGTHAVHSIAWEQA